MRITIFYQSATGNTRLIAETMAETFRGEGCECALTHVRDAGESDAADADMLGVASPVYGFRPARNVLRFLRDLPEQPGKPAFVLCTCAGWASNSVRTLWRALERKGLRVLGGRVIRGEDSWPCLRMGPFTPGKGRPDESDLAAASEFARQVLRRSQQAEGALPKAPRLRPDPLHLVGLLATWGNLRRSMLGKRVDAAKCTRCGLCAEICPTRAITLDDLPRFSSACMGCFGCINLCPESAIHCPLSWGRSPYRGPRRAAEPKEDGAAT